MTWLIEEGIKNQSLFGLDLLKGNNGKDHVFIDTWYLHMLEGFRTLLLSCHLLWAI